MYTVLLVEDNSAIIMGLEYLLKENGYEVLIAQSKTEALRIIDDDSRIDIILLDIMLPDGDGFSLCRYIKEKDKAPVIFLTAKDEETDVVMGFDLGADDYIEKPFEPLELMARVKAQLRRFTRYNDGSGSDQEDTLEISGLILNRATHQCTYGEEEITLTPLEFSILWILTQNRGKVISSENLFEQVWKEKYFKNNNNTVMVHIRHLREKLGDVMGHKELIKTVWGVGYKVEE